MLDILRQYLTETATPEMLEALEESQRVFALFELEDHEREYEEILLNDDQVEPGDTLVAIADMTINLLRQILARHGVTLVGDLRLSTINTLVRALVDIQSYEDRVAIVNLTGLPIASEEILAECLALVCPLEVVDILSYLDNVEQTLIHRLSQINFDNHLATEDIELSSEAVDQRIKQLKDLLRHIGSHDLYVLRLVESGVTPGYGFEVYIAPELLSMDAKQAARELLAAAFVSREATKNPRATIASYLDKQSVEPDQATQINIELNKLLIAANDATSTTGRAQT